MLTANGCKTRIRRFLDQLRPGHTLVLADPVHLRYFANAWCDPFNLGADFPAYLVIQPDGQSTLVYDHRSPKGMADAFVDHREPVSWYDGQTPGKDPRRMVVLESVKRLQNQDRIHDSLFDPLAPKIHEITSQLRRQKDPDEIELLKACMRATEVGHEWANHNVKPGMTELDVYTGVAAACTNAVGWPVVTYGDFAVSPGPAKRGGMASRKVLMPGEMFILDFSVVIQGYRSDFTNTIFVGGQPTTAQRRLYELCQLAMSRAEETLRAGQHCQIVYDAVHQVFEEAGVGAAFPHHAGHGLGACHPEAPYFVKHSEDELMVNDVVTLEPGLYVEGVGGVRIEHNYQITKDGFIRLSNHKIGLP